MRPTPIEPDFTFDAFAALIASLLAGEKRNVKALLTQDQLIPGLGNAIAQDIMFRADLHPKHPRPLFIKGLVSANILKNSHLPALRAGGNGVIR